MYQKKAIKNYASYYNEERIQLRLKGLSRYKSNTVL
ncbi:IS3 family transposase [Aggregatibacter sp. HMT-949]